MGAFVGHVFADGGQRHARYALGDSRRDRGIFDLRDVDRDVGIFRGLFGRLAYGTGYDPARRSRAGLCGAGVDDLGCHDPLSDLPERRCLVGGPRVDRLLFFRGLRDSGKLAQQRCDERKPGAGAVIVYDRANLWHRYCASAFAYRGPFRLCPVRYSVGAGQRGGDADFAVDQPDARV